MKDMETGASRLNNLANLLGRYTYFIKKLLQNPAPHRHQYD
ncbi:hypothetical protein ACIQD3_22290 [Peribacillus loiseleuriae]